MANSLPSQRPQIDMAIWGAEEKMVQAQGPFRPQDHSLLRPGTPNSALGGTEPLVLGALQHCTGADPWGRCRVGTTEPSASQLPWGRLFSFSPFRLW